MSGKQLTIPGSVGDVSDGYHTFSELYAHRNVLFLALMAAHPSISWAAEKHHDGTMFDDSFIAGMDLPGIGQVSYHFPINFIEAFALAGIETFDAAPKWDGHNSEEVGGRLLRWAGEGCPT